MGEAHAGAGHEVGEAWAFAKEHVLAFAAAVGVGFGIEKTIEGVKELAEWGEKTENVAASIGVKPLEFAQLAGAFELVGGNAETATRTVQILERNIRNALADPHSEIAAHFSNLKISIAEMNEMLKNPIAIFDILSDRVKRFIVDGGEAGRALAEFKDIAGRGGLGESLIAGLKGGPELLRELKREWTEATGIRSEKQIADLAEIDKKIHLMNASWTGLKAAILAGFNQPIQDAMTATTTWLKDAKNIESIKDIFAQVGAEVKVIADVIKATSEEIKYLKGVYDQIRNNDASLVYGKTGQALPPSEAEGVAAVKARKAELSGVTGGGSVPLPSGDMPIQAGGSMSMPARPHGIAGAPPGVPNPPVPAVVLGAAPGEGMLTREHETAGHVAASAVGEVPGTMDPKASQKALEEALKTINEEEKARQKQLDFEVTAARGNQTQIDAIEEQKKAIALAALAARNAAEAKFAADTGQRAKTSVTELIEIQDKALKLQIKGEETAAASKIKGLEADRKVADIQQTSELAKLEGRRRTGDLTVAEAASRELQIVEDHKASVDRILADEMRAAGEIRKLADDVAARKIEADAKYEAEKTKIQIKASVEEAQRAAAIDKQIASSASQAIVGVAWGKTTPGQAVASTAQSLETKALEFAIEKGMKASGVGKALDKVFDTISEKVFGKGIDVAANAAEAVPLTTAATALGTSAAGLGTSAVGLGTSAAALTTAAGALASAAAASGGGSALGALGAIGGIAKVAAIVPTIAEGGGLIPSAAGGMVNDGKGGRMIIAHPNEMVLPSYLSQGVQNMIASGGGASGGVQQGVALHYSPQINAPESPDLKQLLQRQGNDMLYWLQAQHRSGAYRIPA